MPDSAGMTPDELAEAKRYGRLELICGLADKAIDIAYLAVAAFLLAQPVDRWLNGFSLPHRNASLRLLLLFLLLTAGHIAVSFPLVILLRACFGASIQPEHADVCRLAVAICQTKFAGFGIGRGLDARTISG